MTLTEDAGDWDDLRTVTSFDKGSPVEEKLFETIEPSAVASGASVTTPISLLVQTLVKQLCVCVERDRDKATVLYDSLCEKLHRMQLLDETYSKGEFEEMRFQYQMALDRLVNVTGDTDSPFRFQTTWPINSSVWSRYYKDFEEISFIAGGGFGKVYKAKNCLDGMQYAVKKIHIRAKEIDSVSKHFDEVKTFASLSHPNIVPYKAAWLEPYYRNENSGVIEDLHENDNTSSDFDYGSEYLSNNNSDFEVVFENSKTDNAETKNVLALESNRISEDCKALCKITNRESINYFGTVDLQWATLYIQMEFCDKTLKTWLDDRNLSSVKNVSCQEVVDISTTLSMFSQLVKGVNYIHTLKIVHHDIKPTNIFISEGSDVNVKLGDFGLACPLQRSCHIPASGTCLYAAPEQIKGKCHEKNDIYSIGFILLELIHYFGTDMEKVKTFKQLRDGRVPDDVTRKYPKISKIMTKLVNHDIEERIDTVELLYILKSIKTNKRDTINTLQKEIKVKNKIIEKKDEEIEKLKKLLLINNIHS